MKFKNKIFITFLFLLAFILFFNINNVFAFTFKSHNSDVEYTVPDLSTVDETQQELLENGYVIIIPKNSTTAWLYVETNPTGPTRFHVGSDNVFNTSSGWYRKSINFTTASSWGTLETKQATYYTYGYDTHDFYFGTTIYTDAKGSEVFFHPPVTEQGVVIPALETAEQIPQAIAKTLKIMIPVGLIVLAIGLVIYLIKRVIYSVH